MEEKKTRRAAAREALLTSPERLRPERPGQADMTRNPCEDYKKFWTQARRAGSA